MTTSQPITISHCTLTGAQSQSPEATAAVSVIAHALLANAKACEALAGSIKPMTAMINIQTAPECHEADHQD